MKPIKRLFNALLAIAVVASILTAPTTAFAGPCYVGVPKPCYLGPQPTGIYCAGIEKKAYCTPLVSGMQAVGGYPSGHMEMVEWYTICEFRCVFFDCDGGMFDYPETRQDGASGPIGPACGTSSSGS